MFAGLETSYTTNERQHKMMWQLMVLPLLPVVHVEPVFRKLQQQYAPDSPAVADLLQYIKQTWIVNSLWSPVTISVYQ